MALKEKLDRILNSQVVAPEDAEVRNKLLAAGFVLVNKDGVVYSKAAGRLDFPTSAAPYTTSSICWIASMSKLITSTCLLQLVEKGLITLDEDLRPRVPQLAQMEILRGFDQAGKPILEPNTQPMTLRQLLTHTVGLGYDLADPDLTRWSEAVGRTSTTNLEWSMAGFTTPLKFTPGEGWLYGTAVDWAGHLLTLLTGQSLSAYMQEHVFAPLGVESTTFWPEQIADSEQRTLAFAFATEESNGDTLLSAGPSPLPTRHLMESGGAGLFTTPADYGRLLHGVLTHRLLSPATADLAFALQLGDAPRAMMQEMVDGGHDSFVPELPRGALVDHSLVGLVNVDDVEGKRRAGSVMWSGMSNGRWWIDRQTGVAAAILTNVLPHGSKLLADVWVQLESAVYEELNLGK
jgi:CubicO group peptidase (beta-lactamase class C family)